MTVYAMVKLPCHIPAMINRRKHPRRDIRLDAIVTCRLTGDSFPCAILDISHSGARFAFADADRVPTHFTVMMPGGVMRCCSVVRRRGPYASARFVAADVISNLAALGGPVEEDRAPL
ncbi:hypothetical protein GCM10007276_15350 [Agaricicola taiwanensis]|uniref:PilZ domain-containing protein n=1 Tax=Agaricicola taiwanensis TaxID=591372 RepID=A0A8J2VS80_9RHOB|nr:PilZ domain-containing protein [Agaricicola taiwanensis]GGE38944.1 hypothetical protein GCM10007276_15350 [Agaricicola taiwanensis]